MNPELVISNEIAIKYIRNTLTEKEAQELEQLFDSEESYRLLAGILQECRRRYPDHRHDTSFSLLSFEQIDNIILQSISGMVTNDSLDHMLYALDKEHDLMAKLLTRIQSNVAAGIESENVSLEGIEMLSDDALLQKMNINTTAQDERTAFKEEDTSQSLLERISDFISSLIIPKPAYYLVPLVLIALFVGFESSLFFAEQRIIDDYALDNWQHYEVDITTLRSTEDLQMNPDMLALVNSQRMALSSFIAEDYAEAIRIFDNVITHIQDRNDIADDLQFDIYFMAGMSCLSFAMTDEATYDEVERRNTYLNAAIAHFEEAKKYMENESTDDKNALFYHLGLGLVFQDRNSEAKEALENIEDGLFLRHAETLKKYLLGENHDN